MSEIQNSSVFALDEVSDEEMNKLIDGTITAFDEGDLVTGTVVKIEHDEVLLDIGFKSEGVIPGRELFNQSFFAKTGIPLDDPVIAEAVTAYERTVVPAYRDGIVSAAPRRGMKAAVERTHELGLRCALASNPVFSLEIDQVRMAWADVSTDDFELISTIDNSRRSKPCADYYLDFIGSLGLAPQECLMVGNDARRDFPRPDIGLRTLYVGHARPGRAFWTGRPERLAPDLEALVERANRLSEA